MNKNNGVTVTLPDNGMCALVKKIDGRYEIDTGRIERKDIFLSPWVKTSDRLPTEDDADPCLDVFAWHIDDGVVVVGYDQVQDYPDLHPLWMSIPPLPEKEEQEPWPGDDLDCPNCGAMLELVAGGMLECHLCGFSGNDTAEVEE